MNDALTTPAMAGTNHTRWCLATYYGLAVVWGVRSLYQERESPLDYLEPLAMTIALGSWAIVDARRRGHPIPLLSRGWFFVFAGILVPGYAIGSKGWRGAGWVIFHGIAWYVLAALTMYGIWALVR